VELLTTIGTFTADYITMYLRNEFTNFLPTILASSDYKTELEGSTPYMEVFLSGQESDGMGKENLGPAGGGATMGMRDAVHAMQCMQ